MPSANQFTTSGAGAGFDPDADQRQRSLGSQVNAGQALPNLDPGKIANPYAGGTPNPYQQPAAPGSGGSSDAAAGQHPEAGNPYRSPASVTDTTAQTTVQRQAMAQAPNAAPQSAATPQPLQVSATGTYQPAPLQLDAYGQSLQGAAQGQRTGAQQDADRVALDDNYKDNATRAAERGAAGGSLGQINDMATRIAQTGIAEREKARASDTAAARNTFNQYQDTQVTRENARIQQEEEQKRIDEANYQAILQAGTAQHAQANEAEIARKNREAGLWQSGITAAGNLVKGFLP